MDGILGAGMSQLLKLTGAIADPCASVIFVHGLGGGLCDTWQRASDAGSFWPLWLAEDIAKLAVYSVGYEASISRWGGVAMHLIDQATSVLERLLVDPDLQQGPLILIGHSFGGLVIKELLRTADSEALNRAEAASLIQRVRKVVFLATPHTGSGLAVWGDRLRILIRPSAATASLLRNDPNLRGLNRWYRNWATASGVAHLILVETRRTRIFGMLVGPDSSDPGFAGSYPVPIEANHTEICKPNDRSSNVYVLVRAFIERRIEPPTALRGEHLDLPTNIQSSFNMTSNITININDSWLRSRIEEFLRSPELEDQPEIAKVLREMIK
jgi:pimeloyl-ACP methyl ester carboxylesterase